MKTYIYFAFFQTWHPDHKAEGRYHPNEKENGQNIKADQQGRWKV